MDELEEINKSAGLISESVSRLSCRSRSGSIRLTDKAQLTWQNPIGRRMMLLKCVGESGLHELRVGDLDVSLGLLGRHNLKHQRVLDPNLN